MEHLRLLGIPHGANIAVSLHKGGGWGEGVKPMRKNCKFSPFVIKLTYGWHKINVKRLFNSLIVHRTKTYFVATDVLSCCIPSPQEKSASLIHRHICQLRQLQMFQRVEYGGGPTFKVVLEC